MNLLNASQIRFNGSDITLIKLDGTIVYEVKNEEPFYALYTVDSSCTEALNHTEENGYYCTGLPKIFTKSGNGFNKYEKINIILKTSWSGITDVTTTCDNISYVELWCPETTTRVSFEGHWSALYKTSMYKSITCYNTSGFTTMANMFAYCRFLTQLNLSNCDTSNVTTMNNMFRSCANLPLLDVSNFNTSKVTNMSYMFNSCASLTQLDLSNFNTSNVNDMASMFYGCTSLTSIDVSNFDTSNVTNMNNMFYWCTALTSLDVSNFDTSKVTNMSSMFSGCNQLTQLDVSNFDTSNVNNMYGMFFGCSKLTVLDVSNFDTSNVTNMGSMFNSCTALTTITCNNAATINKIASELPTRTADAPGTIITDCPKSDLDITTLSSKGWNVESSAAEEEVSPYYVEYTVDNTSTYPLNGGPDSYSYCGIPKIGVYQKGTGAIYQYDTETIEITLLDGTITTDITVPCSQVAKVKMWYLASISAFSFEDTSEVKTVEYCNTSNFTFMGNMFRNCNKLTSLDLSGWDISNVITMYNMFNGCTELVDFIAPNNISVSVDFSSCTKLTHDSLMSIINNLATVTSTTKLTLGSTNLAKLTSAEKAIATNKGWTVS